MLRSLLHVSSMLAALVCAAPVHAGARRPAPRAPNLEGTWTHASAGATGPVEIAACYASYYVIHIEQRGSVIVLRGESVYDGGASPPPLPYEELKGRLEGNRLKATGVEGRRALMPRIDREEQRGPSPVTLELTYDAKGDRLVGTRNGEAYTLVRLVVKRPPRCGPAPP